MSGVFRAIGSEQVTLDGTAKSFAFSGLKAGYEIKDIASTVLSTDGDCYVRFDTTAAIGQGHFIQANASLSGFSTPAETYSIIGAAGTVFVTFFG